ncbi:hypothetical protein AVEN_88612-1 [Araneus ventricosus]|uniref:Uncharacterized protein n=1 Tax=Araneus ventricosus TaxID=182803 RepID=A0A4Y2FPA6_ARAVE|nr:hypothetical protein AVEN_88612-1 [Araneus ventricosus]
MHRVAEVRAGVYDLTFLMCLNDGNKKHSECLNNSYCSSSSTEAGILIIITDPSRSRGCSQDIRSHAKMQFVFLKIKEKQRQLLQSMVNSSQNLRTMMMTLLVINMGFNGSNQIEGVRPQLGLIEKLVEKTE